MGELQRSLSAMTSALEQERSQSEEVRGQLGRTEASHSQLQEEAQELRERAVEAEGQRSRGETLLKEVRM